MADAARKEIAVREQELYDAFNSDEYDKAAQLYTEDACVMPHKSEAVTGRAAIKAVFEKMMPSLKKLVTQGIFHFDLINDSTAYTNSNLASVDDTGSTKMAFRDCLLWKKIGGVWFINRDIFNGRPE